jgi:SAM-dependent methyltransferase
VPDAFTFVRCRACRHVYLDPRPSVEDLPIIYPSNYYAFSEGGSRLVARLRRRWEGRKVALYRTLMTPGRRRVLDAGCGNGRFLRLLRDFGDPDWELVGIDFDHEAVAACRAEGFRAEATRIEEFRAEEASFDAIVMLQLIEHVEDPGAIVDRIYALLRPGGVFVVETPNLAGWDYALFKRSWWGHYHFPRHWNLFSTDALQRLLQDRGFTVERTDCMISTSAWIISIHNALLDRGWPAPLVRFFHYQNPLLLAAFVLLDASRVRMGLATSNQRVVARKTA